MVFIVAVAMTCCVCILSNGKTKCERNLIKTTVQSTFFGRNLMESILVNKDSI